MEEAARKEPARRMTAFWALFRKDLRIFFGGTRAVFMAFAAPILIGSFFGYVFGGLGEVENASRVKVLFVDQQPSTITRQLMDSLQREPMLDLASAQLLSAQEQVKKGRVPVAVLLPPGFGDQAVAGQRLPFEMKEEALTARSGTPYNAYAHSFGGTAIQFMLFMSIDVGLGILLLRRSRS